MLIGDGGGGTTWSAMSMDMMRLLIKTPDTAAYYRMLDGWKQSYELLNAHKWQVESYRNALAVAWPPDKSEAANAYVARLNEMLANLDQTYEAALQNHRAFADAALSISLAQSDFDRIDQEYSSNQTALNAFESKTAQDTTSTEKSTPPVANGRQEELRLQAAARLSSVSTDLAQAQAQIRQPVRYDLLPLRGAPDSHDGGDYVPPVIPPVTPSYVETDAATERSTRPSVTFPGGSGATTGGQPVTAHPVSPLPVSIQPVVSPQQPGLILGGTGTPIATPPSAGVIPNPPSLPGGGTGPLLNPSLPTATNAFRPTDGTSTGLPRAGGGRAQEVTSRQALGSPGVTEGVHAMPPGGMIGGPSGRSTGQTGTSRSVMRRVNPVGGMIGEGEPSPRAGGRGPLPYSNEPVGVGGRSATAGHPRAGGRGMSAGRSVPEGSRAAGPRGTLSEHAYGHAGGQKSTRNKTDETQRWDPDNPWETDEGVEPVLLPPLEQRVDPGPAIGLH
jgi:hypothetical protein